MTPGSTQGSKKEIFDLNTKVKLIFQNLRGTLTHQFSMLFTRKLSLFLHYFLLNFCQIKIFSYICVAVDFLRRQRDMVTVVGVTPRCEGSTPCAVKFG